MSRKILIVDDEPNIVMSLEYTFKKHNYEVFIARDGSEAMSIMEAEIPDIMLLDIMMPKVDGYQTLKFVKENKAYKDVKVIFLTAKNKSSDIEKGLAMGVNRYVTKPFSVKKLLKTVNDLVK